MTPNQFECAFFAETIWRLAQSNNTDELLAIGSTIRNHVIPRMGQRGAFNSYSEACEAFLSLYPVRERPGMQEQALVSYPDGLLAVIDGIYDCSIADLTASSSFPNGAKYFARVTILKEDDWRKRDIVDRQGIHSLIGTWGAQQFFT